VINYSISPDENIVYCRISGELNVLHFTHYVNNLLEDKNYHLMLNAVITVSENTNMSYVDNKTWIAEFLSLFIEQRKGVAWAFVARSNITAGLVRLVMGDIDTSLIDVDFFSAEADAKKWIATLS